jgi:hypothetical protein
MSLEALTDEQVRERLGYGPASDERVQIAPLAAMVRTCVGNWRSPARARVSAYLHRQIAAAGYAEEHARDRVRDVIDALIDIGDLISVRLDGNLSLVRSRATSVLISPRETVLLGEDGREMPAAESWRYARSLSRASDDRQCERFEQWVGPAEFRSHQSRRSGVGSATGTIREYWSVLASALRHDGSPIDATMVRAVIGPASAQISYFGRHNLPTVEGRWSSEVPPGIWCGVRPGRNAGEWHPILVQVEDGRMQALDLFDWDEWNWALLARGIAVGPAERSAYSAGVLAFEHPVPRQFIRALRLLGGPGERPWTWRLSEDAFHCFDEWRSREL